MPETTYNMAATTQAIKGEYFPLRFSCSRPRIGRVKEIVTCYLNNATNEENTSSSWEKKGRFVVNWQEETKRDGQKCLEPRTSVPFSFSELCSHVRNIGKIDAKALTLPVPSSWLDAQIIMAKNFHAPSNSGPDHLVVSLTPGISSLTPFASTLDREGVAYSNMQRFLTSAILDYRKILVESSNRMLATDSWYLMQLSAYLNSCVALIEVTLNSIYYKAKYEHDKLGWNFDEAKLGSVRQGRLSNKFEWIGKITRKPLHDATPERLAFARLKSVRNHLHHFDPPIFAFTIEEISSWLNLADSVATLLWKIRRKIGVPLSFEHIGLLLAPLVEFVPHDPGKKRHEQPSNVGYKGCASIQDPQDH